MHATAEPRTTVTLPSDRELVIERTFDAPKRLVFEATTKPEHVRHWYGLRSTEMVVCEIDLRPGGSWRYVLRGPDGVDHGFSGVYREVSPPDRLVYTEGYEAIPGAESVVTATLEEEGGRTKLRAHLLYPSREHRDGHLQSGMEGGMREAHERLDAVLAGLTAAGGSAG